MNFDIDYFRDEAALAFPERVIHMLPVCTDLPTGDFYVDLEARYAGAAAMVDAIRAPEYVNSSARENLLKFFARRFYEIRTNSAFGFEIDGRELNVLFLDIGNLDHFEVRRSRPGASPQRAIIPTHPEAFPQFLLSHENAHFVLKRLLHGYYPLHIPGFDPRPIQAKTLQEDFKIPISSEDIMRFSEFFADLKGCFDVAPRIQTPLQNVVLMQAHLRALKLVEAFIGGNSKRKARALEHFTTPALDQSLPILDQLTHDFSRDGYSSIFGFISENFPSTKALREIRVGLEKSLRQSDSLQTRFGMVAEALCLSAGRGGAFSDFLARYAEAELWASQNTLPGSAMEVDHAAILLEPVQQYRQRTGHFDYA